MSIFTVSCISRDDDNASTTWVVSTLIDIGNLYGNGDEGIAEQNLVISDATQWNASTIITQPYHIVKIQKSDLPVVFE